MLESELQDIQSGRISLAEAFTFHKVAKYRKQPVETIYNQIFEEVCARLQADEQISVSSQIHQYLSNFPPIFSQPERKAIIEKFRTILEKASDKMFGKEAQSTKPWCCIEADGSSGMSLFVSGIERTLKRSVEITEMNTQSDTPQVGELVELTSGERGTLICSHEMGLTPLDLFNDIVTDPADMRNFLGDSCVKETDRSSLSIKAYLKFCKITDHNHWDFERDTVDKEIHIKVEQVDDYEEIETIDTMDGQQIVQQDDSYDIFSDTEDSQLSPSKPKKPKKEPKSKSKTEVTKESKRIDAARVLECCQICNPGTEEVALGVGQSIFDKEMSNHLLEVHQIEDDVRKFKKFHSTLRKKLSDTNHLYDNKIMKCLAPGCTFQYPISQYQANLHRIARHVEYHEELKRAGKTHLVEIEDGKQVASFPCTECDIEPFPNYSELSSHKNRSHPDFMFQCRDKSCAFESWGLENRARHWQMVHECRKHTCDICGKSYKDITGFNNHMKGHDKSNESTCELCGKVFPTPLSFKEHKK